MKREFKGFLACMAVVLLMGAARKYTHVTQTSLNEGNTPAPYNTVMSASTWTGIGGGALPKRRALGIQAPSANTGIVCVSSNTVTAVTCDSTTSGYQLDPGASMTINDEAAWYGKLYTGTAGRLNGSEHADNRD